MKTTKKKSFRPSITASRFDALVDSGAEILGHLDLSTAKRFAPSEMRLDLTSTKVNIDFPRWMVEELDHASDRIGVPRQSLIKLWLAERLENA